MLKQFFCQFRLWSFIFSVALTTGCAATAFGPTTLQTEVQSAISKGLVNVRLNGTTATLTGRVNSQFDRDRAVNAAKRYEGVEKVVDRLFIFD